MRCGDLQPGRRVWVSRRGQVAHTDRDCRSISRTEAAGLPAGRLHPELDVCAECREKVAGSGRLAEALEMLDPSDLGLSGPGERR